MTRPSLCSFSFNGSFGCDGGFTPKQVGDLVPGTTLSGLINSFRPADPTARMRFNIAVGNYAPPPEAPTIWQSTDGPSESGKAFGGQYVVGKPYLRNGTVVVAVSTTGINDVDDMVFAGVTTNGKGLTVDAVTGHTVEGTTAGPLAQRVIAFDGVTDVKSIRSVEIQFRPIEWCEFENVSLLAGKSTLVKVTTGGAVPTTKNAAVREVYLGGDVKRPGVYSLSPKLLSIDDLFTSAGVTLERVLDFSVGWR